MAVLLFNSSTTIYLAKNSVQYQYLTISKKSKSKNLSECLIKGFIVLFGGGEIVCSFAVEQLQRPETHLILLGAFLFSMHDISIIIQNTTASSNSADIILYLCFH